MKHKSIGLLVILLLLLVLFDTFEFTGLSSGSPEGEKKFTEIPLKVNVMEGADKDIPGVTRADKQKTIEKNVDDVNGNLSKYKVNVRFKLKKINWDEKYPKGVDPSDGINQDESKILTNEMKNRLKKIKGFENGKGSKVTIVPDIVRPDGKSTGRTVGRDPTRVLVDADEATDRTWMHELLVHGIAKIGDTYDEGKKKKLEYGYADGGWEIQEELKKKIEENAKKHDVVKNVSEVFFEPVLISRSWESDFIYDIFYFNSTWAIGYSYIDIADVKSYSEEPFSTREFEIFVDGLFPENVSMIIPIRLYFDTDGHSFTGFNGYDKMLLINMTGFYPFTNPQSLKVINPVTNATIYQTWLNVSVTREYMFDEPLPGYPPPPPYPVSDHISFNLTSSVLSALDFTATDIDSKLFLVDQAAEVFDELTFTFSTLPEQLPTIEVTTHSVTTGTIIGLTGFGFTPLGNVSLYLEDLIIGTVQSNETGGIATNITIPNVLGGGYYFLTAIDPVNLDSAFTILIAIVHDVSIPDVTPSKTIVGQGLNLPITATVQNQGYFIENFNVTVYANTTIITTLTDINLTSGNSTTITFTWNTSGFAKGKYTIWAYAWPVPGETYTADNTFIHGTVYVGIPGDVNGNGKVDILDIAIIAKAYGAYPGHAKWNPNADLDDSNNIDIIDIAKAAKNFGKTDP